MYQNHTSLETNRPKGPPLRGSGPLGLFYVLHFTLIFSLHSLLFTLYSLLCTLALAFFIQYSRACWMNSFSAWFKKAPLG